MAAMMSKSPKLDMKDLKQQAAMPLSNFLRRDPWTDQVVVMHSSYEPLLAASDKMPFEVTPVYLKLGYYKPPADAAPAGSNSPQPAANPAQPAADPGQPATGTAAPAPADSTATPATPTTPAPQPTTPPQN
jgi:hypothetical protein